MNVSTTLVLHGDILIVLVHLLVVVVMHLRVRCKKVSDNRESGRVPEQIPVASGLSHVSFDTSPSRICVAVSSKIMILLFRGMDKTRGLSDLGEVRCVRICKEVRRLLMS